MDLVFLVGGGILDSGLIGIDMSENSLSNGILNFMRSNPNLGTIATLPWINLNQNGKARKKMVLVTSGTLN